MFIAFLFFMINSVEHEESVTTSGHGHCLSITFNVNGEITTILMEALSYHSNHSSYRLEARHFYVPPID